MKRNVFFIFLVSALFVVALADEDDDADNLNVADGTNCRKQGEMVRRN